MDADVFHISYLWKQICLTLYKNWNIMRRAMREYVRGIYIFEEVVSHG